ncbi:MAG: hypothetical protein K2X03_02855 [Bryobacteraceae bacterium]|nr:hypothetical protein [Bryobacteraceae bacterium]
MLALLLLLAQDLSPGTPAPRAAETVLAVPRIGAIDFYGLKRFSPERLLRDLKLKEGDPLPASRVDLEEKLEEIEGVVAARVEAVCCSTPGRPVLYVGIEEKGAVHFDVRPPFEGSGVPLLPADITSAYRELIEAMAGAVRKGEAAEDWSRGHSLLVDETSRGWQLRLLQLADDNLPALRQALKEGDEEERAIAAYTIGYVKNKSAVVNDLQLAIRDPGAKVRENALRSLAAFSVLARKDPSAEMQVLPTWIVEMLHSLDWSDRREALAVLLTLSEVRDPKMMTLLRERSRDTLVEMARWKHLPHALPAYVLLGRAFGMAETEIERTWAADEKEKTIAFILKVKRP